MVFVSLCLQASLLAHPLYLEPEKPELRAAQHILLLHDEVEGLPFGQERNHEDALELMKELVVRIEKGEDFGTLAREHSDARTRASDGSLGSFPPGMLRDPFGNFLFSSEVGQLSSILDLPSGLHLIKRVETHVGVLQIQLDGQGDETRELADRLLGELGRGADFGSLAEDHSTDAASAARSGEFRVFERGSHDSLIKLAAFRAGMGEVVGPIETPIGLHILKRVEPRTLSSDLWEDNFIRARGILISHLGARGADPDLSRTQSEARGLAEEVITRVQKGESFAEIAGRFNDDPGGLERAGNLGWIHRETPDLPHFFSGLFVAKPGTLGQAYLTTAGVVVLFREQ